MAKQKLDTHMIRVHTITRKRLRERGKYGETLDGIINKILDETEQDRQH